MLLKYALGWGSLGRVKDTDDTSFAIVGATAPSDTELPVYLLELDPYNYSLESIQTKRFATKSFATRPSDTPANALYRNLIVDAGSYNRQLGILRAQRRSVPNYGAISMAVSKGEIDDLVTSPLAWDSREFRILLGTSSRVYSDFITVFKGRMDEFKPALDKFIFTVKDPVLLLQNQAQTAKYAGTGGLEGDDSLAGKYKPLCFGYCQNVEPILVDPANRVYQVHSGPINDADVYDQGVLLTKVIGTPAAGEFRVDKPNGTVVLGGATAGLVTVTVWGDSSGSGYTETSTGILDRFLRDYCGFTDSTLGTISVGSYVCGLYYPDGVNKDEFISALIEGIGGWWGFTRDAKFTSRLIDGFSSPVETYTQSDIESMSCQLAPPPVYKFDIGYARTWKVHSDVEIAGSVSAAEKLRLKNDQAIYSNSQATVLVNSPNATELKIEGILKNKADAQIVEGYLRSMFSTYRRVWQVAVRGRLHELDVGDTVRIKIDRFGMDDGVDMFVDGISETTATGLTTLTLVQ